MIEESVRREYRAALAELTFNSRPIIHNLTDIAFENIAFAPAIVEAVEQQLRNAVPRQKLPILYLIDSICKNVGAVYPSLFARNLEATFKGAYEVVDPEDQKRFARVVDTWKTHPTGPLFATPLLLRIEALLSNKVSYLNGGRGPGPQFIVPPQQQGRPLNRVGSGFTQNGNRNQVQLPRYGAARPSGPIGMPPTRPLVNYASRLSHFGTSIHHSLPAMPAVPAIDPVKLQLQQQIQALLMQKQQVALLNPLNDLNNKQLTILSQLLQLVQSTHLDANMQFAITQELQQFASPSPAPLPLVGMPAPVSANKPVTFDGEPSHSQNIRSIERVYLTTEAVNKKQLHVVSLMYDVIELQCHQCGVRYYKSAAGKRKMEAHLDWHFRMNRRLKERARKPMSRDWFIREEDWVAERESDVKENIKAGIFPGATEPEVQVEEKQEVPNLPLDSDQVPPCGICSEVMEKFFDNEQEDWMIRNAIKVDDKLYHWTCWTLENPNSVLGKRKTDDGKESVPAISSEIDEKKQRIQPY